MKKLLSVVLVFVMAVSMSLTTVAAQVNASGKTVTKTINGKNNQTWSVTGIAYESEGKEVLRIMNNERAAQGLDKLTWESDLYDAAVLRALEQYVTVGYPISHTRPNGKSWTTVHKLANGENLAAGDTSASDVMRGWMNSPDHRTNILDADYNSVAVACVETDRYIYWVQLFHSDKTVSADDPNAKTTKKTETDSASTSSSGSGKTVSAKDVTSKLASSSKATIKNAETITPAAMKEIANATAGREVSVVFSTSFSGKSSTQGQMTVNPAAFANMDKNLSLKVVVEGSDVEKVAANFGKWYKNDVAVIQMSASGALHSAVRVAAKPAALKGLDSKNLEFYTYSPSTKKINRLENTNYSVDKSGFVHFNTARGDFIIVSDGVLTK